MKVVHSFIKYIALILLLVGLTVSFANQNKEKADNREEDKKKIVSANNKFALNLYSYLSSENPGKNIFFSPYGIFTAMAMAYEGADNQTADEIKSVFYFPENHDIRRSAIGHIYNQLNQPKTEYQLLTANALWIQKNLQLNLIKEIQKYYRAEVFINTPAEKVNQWIEHKTRNKFKNVVEDCPACVLSLINTIYFKGDWNQKFEKSKTKESPFIISKKEKVSTPMMYAVKTFNYMETETMQMLEMFYKGEELSMLVLLPKDFPGKLEEKKAGQKKSVTRSKKKRSDLTFLEKTLTEKQLRNWKKALFKKEVEVHIPKFTFRENYELSKTLKPYMPLAFNTKKADFSKFGLNNLYIGNIIHKSFIDVNEEGTEAAAVTVVYAKITSSPPPPPVFKANHPFLFLIQERKTGQILFIGKVVNPT